MLEVGKLYKVWGNKVQRVSRVTRESIYVTWENGQVPQRQSDRVYPITHATEFVAVKNG
jgi:hypothetical protein